MVLLALAALPAQRSKRWIPFSSRLGVKSVVLDGQSSRDACNTVKADAQIPGDRNSSRVFSEELIERELPSVSG